jgi:sortase B
MRGDMSNYQTIKRKKPKETETKGTLRKIVSIVLLIFFACVFLYSGYRLYDYFHTSAVTEEAFNVQRGGERDRVASGEEDYAEAQKRYLKLHEQNSDFVGWIKAEGTLVDYPVMQTPEDLEFYIHRDFEKKYSYAGTPFANSISDVDRPSDLILIYAHKMKNGTMFGQLSKYEDATFLEAHNQITLDTLTERREYKIFSIFITDVDTGKESEFAYYNVSNFEKLSDFQNFMESVRAKQVAATTDEPEFGDELIALSTCEYSTEFSRLVVLGYRDTGRVPNAGLQETTEGDS